MASTVHNAMQYRNDVLVKKKNDEGYDLYKTKDEIEVRRRYEIDNSTCPISAVSCKAFKHADKPYL